MQHIWQVFPRDPDRPVVATGVTDNLGHAKRFVEATLNAHVDVALMGLCRTGPATFETCHRNRAGDGFVWRLVSELPELTEPPNGA